MLSRIRIENFALIDKLDVEFGSGLNVITGSTGAGKSILVGALKLALGGRASEEMIRSGERRTIVEATFETGNAKENCDEATERGKVILRREYRKKGGSRLFINGKQATQAAVKNMSENLASVLGQHSHQTLLDPSSHLEYLDNYGIPRRKLSRLHDLYERAAGLRDKISYSKRHAREIADKIDLISFQIDEIERAGLRIGEEEKLKEEKAVLENASRLREAGEMVCSSLLESDDSAVERIGVMEKSLKEIPGFAAHLENIVGLMKISADTLNEAVVEMRNLLDRAEDDPERLELINKRLYELSRLKKKYGGDATRILKYLEESRQELELLKSGAGDSQNLEMEFEQTRESMNKLAREISQRRRKAKLSLEKIVNDNLSAMGMLKARFVVEITNKEDDTDLYELDGTKLRGDRSGFDMVEFQFSANPGEELKPLVRIASGGEISRVMLALKDAFAGGVRGGCDVFDEIDVGISGEVAAKIAARLKSLSSGRQVICVTHLHQIASAADRHYRVLKEKKGRRSVTSIRKLNREERIREVAALLSGEKVTEKAMAGAKEMIEGPPGES
jgi:DNA repair protein RecN (Recombination protein N)